MRHDGRDIDDWKGREKELALLFRKNMNCDCIAGAIYFDSSISPVCKDHFCFAFITLFMFPVEGNIEGVIERKLEETTEFDAS
jgi:hypothetical protein